MAAILRISAKALAVLPSLYGSGKASGVRRWREYSHPRYATMVEEWEAKPPEDLPAVGLLAGARELLDAGTEYYTSVQTIIPIAATSEVLFTGFYDRLIRREGDPPAQTFLLGFDSTPIRAEKSLYDLAMWCGEHPELAAALLDTPSERALELLRMEVPPAGVDERGVGRVAVALPDSPGPLRARRLQPGLREPRAGRRPRAPLRHAQVLPAGRRTEPPRAPAKDGQAPRGGDEGGAGAAGPCARKALRQATQVGAGRGSRARGRPRRYGSGLARDAADAPRIGPPPASRPAPWRSPQTCSGCAGRSEDSGRVPGRGRDATRKPR